MVPLKEYQKQFIYWIFILSLVDGTLTIYSLDMGIAVEANPIMSYLIAKSILLFLFTKAFLTFLGLVILYKNMEKYIARIALSLIFLLYTLIITIHISGIVNTID